MASRKLSSALFTRRTFLAGIGAGTLGVGGLGLKPLIRQGELPAERPTIIGHRGAQGLEPPNTIAAVRAALDAGADGIEIDVWQTADDELVLFHDPVLDWDSTGEGLIEATVWDEIEGAEIHGEPLVRLPRVLEEIQNHDVELYIELKTAGFTDRVLETVARYDLLDSLTIISFSEAPLEPALEAGVPTGLVGTMPTDGLVTDAVAIDSDLVFSHYVPHAAPRFLEKATEEGLTGGLWKLVETSSTLHDALEAGPAVIVTNYPDKAIELLENR